MTSWPKPEIGSMWKARDGRILRVDSIVVPDLGIAVVVMTVMNARNRMKKTSTMGLGNFSSKEWSAFLSPLEPN